MKYTVRECIKLSVVNQFTGFEEWNSTNLYFYKPDEWIQGYNNFINSCFVGSYQDPTNIEPMMQDLDLGSGPPSNYSMDHNLPDLGPPTADLNLDGLPPADNSGLAFFDTDL